MINKLNIRRTLILIVFVVTSYIIYIKSNFKEFQIQTSEGHTNEDKFNFNLRAVCIVLTQIKNHKSRVRAVADTWGRRCKHLIYVTNSTIHLDDQHVFDMKRKDSYHTIWGKVKQAIKYSYTHFKNEVDWFIKADDDSYLVMENIQSFIESKNIKPSDPTWFGTHYKKFTKHGYMAGGGYIMTRETIRRFVEIGLNRTDNNECKVLDDTGAEDVEMGKCLDFVGVTPTDSRDEYGRARCFPFNIFTVVEPLSNKVKSWFWNYIKYPHVFGHPGCCSDTSMTFHYVDPEEMYKYEYLLYSTKIVGENHGKRAAPPANKLAINIKFDEQNMPKML